MGTGEFPTPHTISIPMHYAVLLRDLGLSVPVFDGNFKLEEFSTIFGALKGLQVRMVNFEHSLDKIELGMTKLEHRIDNMERHMEQLQKELEGDADADADSPPSSSRHDIHHYYIEDSPAHGDNDRHHLNSNSHASLLALQPPTSHPL